MPASLLLGRALLAVGLVWFGSGACAGPGDSSPVAAQRDASGVLGPRIAAPAVELTSTRGDYGEEPAVVLTPTERSALEALRRERPSRPPTTSSALVLAARELARRAASGEAQPLARAHVRAALARALGFDPAPVVRLIEAPAAAAAVRLLAQGGREPVWDHLTHVGVGSCEQEGRIWMVALATRRTAALDKMPRDVTPGTVATLRGRLVGLSQPSVHLTAPGGRTFAPRVEVQGSRFSARLHFDLPGRWMVEVVGIGDHGPEVAALLTVSSGGAPLGAPPLREASEPADVGAAEAMAIEALNATRRAAGLPTLSRSDPVSAVARRHSEEMAARGLLAHELPGSGGVAERLRRARVPFARVRENVALAPSALEAHRAAEESPAHLENILAGDVAQVGCGVARATLPSGERLTYLTEIFIQSVEDGTEDQLRPEARVREALWRERARTGAPPLTLDPTLDALAAAAARDMLRRDEPSARGLAELALELPRKLAAADVFVAARPSEAARSKNLMDVRFRRAGVGVALGDSARHGAGALWIAVIYTD